MKRAKTQKIAPKSKADVKWFALVGYNKDNEDETGMLAYDTDSKPFYKIVHDVKDAMKFPSCNVENVDGFGTPDQWLEFFNTEPELDRWKFHLVKVTKP